MADTSFFGRLRKLFSTQAIVRVESKGRRKVADVDERQKTNLSFLRDRYTKLQKGFYEQAKDPALADKDAIRTPIWEKYYVLLHNIQDTYNN